jgi:hypothetical protein
MRRGIRSSVEDRWYRTVKHPDGTTETVETANHGKGSRWRARYVDSAGTEHAKGIDR